MQNEAIHDILTVPGNLARGPLVGVLALASTVGLAVFPGEIERHPSAVSSRASTTIDLRPTEVLLTGNEQAIADRFTGTERIPAASQFPNSLDNALTVLFARAFPPPRQEQLVEAAVSSMAEPYAQQTAKQVDSDQRKTWVSAILRSGSFESDLDEMASPGLQTEQLVDAGLAGMLRATGWNGARVLSPSQACHDWQRY